jgi:DNA-binding response OmpR family regulator
MTVRILYVDDDDDLREVATMSLGLDPDFEIRECASGPAALEALRNFHPDIVLLDVMMPGMDGPETLRAMREQGLGENVTVLFITARAQSPETARLLSIGASGVIAKPFDPMTLASSLRAFLPQ